MSAGAFVPESYFELVRAFPLTVIRDDSTHAQAVAVLHSLRDSTLPGAPLYRPVLETLVWAYEDAMKDSTEEE